MANWLISVKYEEFDLESAYEELPVIYWSKHAENQNAGFQLGDQVYIYVTQPISKVMYQFKVIDQSDNNYPIEQSKYWKEKEGLNSYTGDFSVFQKICKIDKPTLSRNYFIQSGLLPKTDTLQARRTDRDKTPNNHIKLLLDHIAEQFKIDIIEYDYPDEAGVDSQTFPEGAKQAVLVNKYERNPEARAKCLEIHGTRCKVCDMSFAETYGFFANDFIHVHHIVQLGDIKEEYEVDPETDLIPVCPNCHAMLHKTENGLPMTIDRLKLLYDISKRN
ncbi:HNH endonuclease [Acinetobacter bereziniae]|uniref:HNH endonuclease n=1 Tax=Acinetobacter bereziniae TaxID=106648 RepID=UPI001250C962|nr:HNH endonuclease [Acinetobacter bereziniae]